MYLRLVTEGVVLDSHGASQHHFECVASSIAKPNCGSDVTPLAAEVQNSLNFFQVPKEVLANQISLCK